MILCNDEPGKGELRRRLRVAHLEYLLPRQGAIKFGAPLLSDNGDTVGSLLVVECENRSDADKFIADDPYNTEGLYETITIQPCKQIFPESRPGRIKSLLEHERARAQ